jgi:2-polyprenyl-3-methyl-5-hydroxy-6-metoxy-1,4-benzoquinol methylase
MKPHQPSDPVEHTLAYYESHAEEFIERTANVSMEHLYEPFLALIPPGGRILDAGCGSGRDAAEFARRGYDVVAFDGSAEMARLASERTGLTVLHQTFDQIEWREEFDGVWACASLLHLPSPQLQTALNRIVGGLRRGGVLYVSLKEGHFEGVREERWFTDSTAAGLRRLLADTNTLDVIGVWETVDARPRATTTWVNALARQSRASV